MATLKQQDKNRPYALFVYKDKNNYRQITHINEDKNGINNLILELNSNTSYLNRLYKTRYQYPYYLVIDMISSTKTIQEEIENVKEHLTIK